MDLREVGDRHLGTAAGLRTFDPEKAVRVGIKVAPEVAELTSVQHVTWMTLNMLARLALLVDEVIIDCPRDPELDDRVIPFAAEPISLATGLLMAGTKIGVVPVRLGNCEAADLQLHAGPGGPPSAGLRVHGEAWTGGFSRASIEALTPESNLPFGPYIAACLGVGEVFRAIRVDGDRHPPPNAVFYSGWTNRTMSTLDANGPSVLTALSLDASLGGVGAVGAAWMHAIWATPAVSGRVICADADREGIDESNLNRGVLFTADDVGAQKAEVASAAVRDSAVEWKPVNTKLEAIVERPPFTIVAVDTNRARSDIQGQYPFPLQFASTYNLRAEIIRCDPTDGGPCMRCRNRPETERPDDELIEVFRQASGEDRESLAHQAGVSLDEAEEWLRDPVGRCATAGAQVLNLLRETLSDDPRLFAVPFVSVFAGAMLAAESVKEIAGGAPSLSVAEPRAVFTFLNPTAETNRSAAYPRDPTCPQCDPSSAAGRIWLRKATSYAEQH
jgi:hypothetical protein